VRDRCGDRKSKPDELSSALIRSKQTTEAFIRFDLGIDVRRTIHRHNPFVIQALVVSLSVIMNEESSNSFERRGLAKKTSL